MFAEIRRTAVVICRSGRSTRPATTQPATTDTTAITPSAIADPSRYWCDVAGFAVLCGWAVAALALAAFVLQRRDA